MNGDANLSTDFAAGFSVTTDLPDGTIDIPLEVSPVDIEVNDEVLIINLQGTPDDLENVGTYEFRRVSAVNDNDIELDYALTHTFPGSSQHVVVQRVPNFMNLEVTSGTLTADAWNGINGGVLAFRVRGTLSIAADSAVNMSDRGYRQGNGTGLQTWGQQGEGIAGAGTFANNSNFGGGGGGISDEDGMGGGGGGYGTGGTSGASTGTDFSGPGGEGAHAYGTPEMTRIFLGGGGGQAGADEYYPLLDNSDAGRGGGIVYVAAAELMLDGQILAEGQPGHQYSTAIYQRDSGAGAGGSIYLLLGTTSGAGLISAEGGPISTNGGGGGGVGRIRIISTSGDTGLDITPEAFETAFQ